MASSCTAGPGALRPLRTVAGVLGLLAALAGPPRAAGSRAGSSGLRLGRGRGGNRAAWRASSLAQASAISSSLAGDLLPDEAALTRELTDRLRFSVVRIENIQTSVNWFEPYGEKPQAAFVGTGFAAKLVTERNESIPANAEEDPVFITNAHVVRNAHVVKIQFPALSQQDFQAHVPLIFEDHDLAIVKLLEPKQFLEYLRANGASLQVLPIRKHEVTMGLNVVAIGFPLASSTLKLSTGVIAGTELVWGSSVFQCTAPISPGNSGGPLLVLGDTLLGEPEDVKELRVVGVNFAATTASGAENVNYVVPGTYIQQIFNKFHALQQSPEDNPAKIAPESVSRDRPAEPAKRGSHARLRLAPIGALPVHANGALYALAGCQAGVYLASVAKPSALANARPPVEAGVFLQAVAGVSIDGFGRGRPRAGFLDDPLPFQSLLQVGEDAERPVEVEVCRNGTVSRHAVSLAWNSSYEPGIRKVTEPHFEPLALDYEVFAGVTIMEMTLNHVQALLQSGWPASYGRWLLPENLAEPRLLVTKVKKGTYAETVLGTGMVLSTLNGQPVSTLAEFREHFEPQPGKPWTLESERKELLVVDFEPALKEQAEGEPYLLTPALLRAARLRGLLRSKPQHD